MTVELVSMNHAELEKRRAELLAQITDVTNQRSELLIMPSRLMSEMC